MPIRTEEEYLKEILSDRSFAPEPVKKEPKYDYGLSTAAFGESFLGKMTMAGYDRFFGPEYAADPDYDVYDDIMRDNLIGWSSYLDDAQSRDEYYQKKSIVEQSIENERMLAEGGAEGLAYQFMWGLADPVNFIPIVGASSKVLGSSASLSSKVATAGAIGGAGQAAQEVVLSQVDPNFNESDAMFSIGAATVLSGVLGPIAMSSLDPKVKDDFSKGFEYLAKQRADDLNGFGSSSASAAQVEKKVVLSKEALEPLSSFGVGRATAFLSPSTRMQNSPSQVVRNLNAQINETALLTKGNVEGITSYVPLEAERRLYFAMESIARALTRDAYLEYRKSLTGKTGNWASNDIKDITGISNKSGILTRQQFYDRVGKAMRRDDVAEFTDFVDANSFIEKAATANRKYFNQLLDEMLEAKVYADVPDLKGTADSWFKRIYDKQKIVSDPEPLKAGLLKYYKEQRDADIVKLGALRNDVEALKKEIKNVRKRKDKDLLGSLQKQLSDKQQEINKLDYLSKAIDEELYTNSLVTIERIKGSPLGVIDYDEIADRARGTSPARQVGMRGTKERKLQMPDTYEWEYNGKSYKLEDFLISDPTAISASVTRSVVPDLLMYRKFGTLNAESFLNDITDDYRKLIDNAKTPKERVLLEKRKAQDLEDLRDSISILRGTYANRDDYYKAVPTALRMAKQSNYLSLMGEMTISSSADIGAIISEYGMKKTFGNLHKAFIPKFRSAVLDMSLEEQKKFVVGIENVMNDRFASIYDADVFAPVSNKAEAGLNYASAAMQKISLMNTWLDALRPLTGVLEQDRIVTMANKVASGKKLSKLERAEISASFLDDNDLMIIADQYNKYGKNDGGLLVPNMRSWDIDNPSVADVQNRMRIAIAKKVDAIIIKPGSEIPKTIKKGGTVSAILQFKSFMFSATNKILTRSAQRLTLGDKRLVMGLSTMVALGGLSYAAKAAIAGRDISDDPRDWITEGIDRSGILGLFGEVNNITEKLTGGKVGIRPLIGAKPATRYINRNHLETFLGPTAGIVQDAGELVQSVASHGNMTQGDLNKLRRHIPFQNAIGIRYLFDGITEGIGDALNLPEKR